MFAAVLVPWCDLCIDSPETEETPEVHRQHWNHWTVAIWSQTMVPLQSCGEQVLSEWSFPNTCNWNKICEHGNLQSGQFAACAVGWDGSSTGVTDGVVVQPCCGCWFKYGFVSVHSGSLCWSASWWYLRNPQKALLGSLGSAALYRRNEKGTYFPPIFSFMKNSLKV